MPDSAIGTPFLPTSLKNIVVFASGSGSNFKAIIEAISANRIHARIAGLIASKPNINAINIANSHNIASRVAHSDHELLETMQDWNPDLIVLAGYLKKIPAALIEMFPNKIINIHPALLPKYGGKGYYGMNVHRAVIDAKEQESGCTIHIVTPEYDEGPILAQSKIPVLPGYTAQDLASAILNEEHKLLPQVIQQLINSEN